MNLNMNRMKMGVVILCAATVLAFLAQVYFVNLELERVEVLTFDAEVKRFLAGDYKTDEEKAKLFEDTIGNAYEAFVEKNIEAAYRKEAKYFVSVSRMQTPMYVEMKHEKIIKYNMNARVKETVKKCQEIYPIKNIKVVVLPNDKGLEGRAVGNNLIIIYPIIAQDEATTLKEIENAIYHEYMHLISKAKVTKNNTQSDVKYTVLNFMIEEGRAVVFAKQHMNGYESSLSKYLKADQPWSFYEALLDATQFGSKEGDGSTINGKSHSFLDYYYYGERLVELYIDKGYEKQPVEWWLMEDAEIVRFIKEQSGKQRIGFTN